MRPPCAEANACGQAAPPTREFTTRSELKHLRASLFRTRSESFQTNAELQRPLAPRQGAFSKLRTRHPEQKTPSPEQNARPAALRAPRATQMARRTIQKARRAAKKPAQAKQHPDQAPKPSHEPNRRTPPARRNGGEGGVRASTGGKSCQRHDHPLGARSDAGFAVYAPLWACGGRGALGCSTF